MEDTVEELCTQLEKRGSKGRVVSIRRVRELQEEIEGRHARGSFDEDFYQERLKFFTFKPPDDFPSASSLVVVAVPCPKIKVKFTRNGKTLQLMIPPTYQGHGETVRQIGGLLTKLLAPHGHRVVAARLPQKALAVRSGLAEYGRNNICYVSGMGSFVQIAAFYSDLACAEDEWREPRMMDRCQSCEACLIKCPTGAITSERFLLHAERCLVFHNERSRDHPFPSWIDPAWHNCLVGCMICQDFCPEDRMFIDWVEGDEEFSEEETSLLLKGSSIDQLPESTKAKLERLELLDSLDTLPRNLGVFLCGE